MVWRFLFCHEFLMQPKGENHELRRILKESKLPRDHALSLAKAIPAAETRTDALRDEANAGGPVQAGATGNEGAVRGENRERNAGASGQVSAKHEHTEARTRSTITMRTEFHGWRSPRKGLHWINVVDGLDRIWLWLLVNIIHFLRRNESRRELERDLDSIRNIKFK
jgi:hypothetical protein